MSRYNIISIIISAVAMLISAFNIGHQRGLETAHYEACDERLDAFRGCEPVATMNPDGGIERGVACVRGEQPPPFRINCVSSDPAGCYPAP